MTPEPTHTVNRSSVQNFLGRTAGNCGAALNSFLVVLGDKCGLYATGQYTFDVEEPIVRDMALSITRKRTSGEAADGVADAHGSATPGEDRAMSVQREETALMTLICHDCVAAPPPQTGNSAKPAQQL